MVTSGGQVGGLIGMAVMQTFCVHGAAKTKQSSYAYHVRTMQPTPQLSRPEASSIENVETPQPQSEYADAAPVVADEVSFRHGSEKSNGQIRIGPESAMVIYC